MNIYERLISILVEQRLDEEPESKDVWSQTSKLMDQLKNRDKRRKQKAKRTKPSVTAAQRRANKAAGRAAINTQRHNELEGIYGDTGIWKGDRP